MSPVERFLQALRTRGIEPKACKDGWTCRCPSHDDQRPSLSIDHGSDGRALVICHAGCAIEDVVAALGLRVRDLMPEGRQAPRAGTRDRARLNGTDGAGGSRPGKGPRRYFPTAGDAVAALEHNFGARTGLWTYHDRAGDPVMQVVRFDRVQQSGTKPVKEFRPVTRSSDGWFIGSADYGRPLYRLPELMAADQRTVVFVCEGEKAADAARGIGLLATTSPHGAKSAAKADWSVLADREVVVLPDHDRAGHQYAKEVVGLLTVAGAKAVRIVRLADLWPGIPEGGDMADFVNHRGSDAESMASELQSAARNKDPEGSGPVHVDGAPVLIRMSDVTPEEVSWLWPERFALGKPSLIAGDPGLGKSFLTIDIAARVSRGAAWPDTPEAPQSPGGVVLLSAEDGISDTIHPRLAAAGAVMDRITVMQAVRVVSNGKADERAFDLSTDLPALETAILQVPDCKLVVIDPLTAYLGKVDSHRNAELRGLLAPLGNLAARHRVAVIAVTHLNKSTGGPAIYRTIGSVAFSAVSRSAWGVTKDARDPDRRLVLPIKNNLAAMRGGLAFRIDDGASNRGPALAWEPEPVMMSADDAMGPGGPTRRSRTERDDAEEWLAEILDEGPLSFKEIAVSAKEAGISIATLRRAKAGLCVRSRKTGGGGWIWKSSKHEEGKGAQ